MESSVAYGTPLLETDGFRRRLNGFSGPGQMNPETLATLTVAHAGLFNVEDGVFGRDPRPSSPLLQHAVMAGAHYVGLEVVNMGNAPTPAILRYARKTDRGMAGVVTASHNPPTYNGYKMTIESDKPNEGQVESINAAYWRLAESGLAVPLDVKTPEEDPTLLERYIEDVVKKIRAEYADYGDRPLDGKIVVVDGANGATAKVTPRVMRLLGATVYEFACDMQGEINDNCGATSLGGVQAFLGEHPEIVDAPNFVGIVAQDGDGDRFIGVGAARLASGELAFSKLDGNRTLEVMVEAGDEPGGVGTHYTNDATAQRIGKNGRRFEWCDNGDTAVTARLRELGWWIGGEFSGHIVDRRWLSSGDGVLTGARMAVFAATHNTTFMKMCDGMPLFPEASVKIELPAGFNKHGINDNPDAKAAISQAEQAGRVVARPSGTEDVYRIDVLARADGKVERQRVTAAAHHIAAAVRTLVGANN